MAAVQRYVNTASSGGDGTTNETSGASAAYASLSSWEANESPGATDDPVVDCCGTSADTTAVTVDFPTTPASILIRGNRGHVAGFYRGNLVISTSHYRLATGAGVSGISISEPNVTLDGIQFTVSGGSFFSAIAPPAGATGDFTVRNCRLHAAAATHYGIGRSASYANSFVFRYENNLVVGFNVDGIQCWGTTFFSAAFHVLHNTVYGDGSCDGIKLVQANAASGAPVFNVRGNAIANSGSEQDIDAAGMLEDGGTINYQDNATEQFDLGTTDEIDLGAPTDAWTSPGTTTGSDFTVKNTASALYSGVSPTLVTHDLVDFMRDGVNHDVGAFELLVPLESLRAVGPGLVVGSANSFVGEAAVGATADPTLVPWSVFDKPVPWFKGPPGLKRQFARPFEPWVTPEVGETPVSAATAAEFEALLGLGPSLSLPFESLLGLRPSVTAPFESLATIQRSDIGPFEALQGVRRSDVAPFESLVGLIAQVIANYEAAGTLQVPVVVPFESLVSLLRSVLAPFEAGQSVALQTAAPFEALAGVLRAVVGPFEAAGTLQAVAVAPYESGLLVARSGAAPFESLDGASAAVAGAFEALGGVRSSASSPFEAAGTLVVASLSPYESVSSLSRSIAAAYESLQGARHIDASVFEASARAALELAAAYEARGQILVAMVVPYEAVALAVHKFLVAVISIQPLITGTRAITPHASSETSIAPQATGTTAIDEEP